jgi:peptidyl-prolyl cis-trans isomerase SurA
MIGGAAMPHGVALRVAAVIAVLLAGPARAEVANRIVATIDGEPITAHELREWVKERGEGEDMTPDQALEALITQKLLEKEIKAQGISARDEDVERYMQEVQGRSGLDEAAFQAALKQRGMTVESYKIKVKEEIERAQLVNKEIRQRVNVSSAEIKRYYEAHLSDYATGEKVKVRAIFLRVDDTSDAEAMARARAKATEIRAGARSSKAFQALAKEHSEGPGAEQGGELGTFSRGEMEGRLEEVAFALKEGEVSEPIDSGTGVTLLFVEERIGGSHRPLDEVSPEIREALYNEALQQRFQDWLSRDLRERHHVEVLN